ncbi:Nitronate monooxygenase [Marinomonas spartinae]|uniref:Nitronate monooxygenase n=1 Tax=Marinomonas spartinae TaxID=1792290 RepID=A0A1A8TEF4_9GAMM|nr:nitronate monooxygenase [Marinomonas spartinae]SBS31657.1 Nitronate monooxygenase [Marinomonas spartinae]
MIKTEFTRLVGCDVPIQQSPMGKGTSTPSLASAVANAGGLGMLSLTGYSGEVIEKIVQDTYALTSKKVGANFLLYQPIDIETVEVAARLLDVVDFFWARPDKKLVDVAKKAGAIASWQVGSLEEALLAEEAGCDFITVQSIEAGGHVRGTIDIFTLLDQVIGAVNIPVLAGGGVGSGESLAAVLAAGAAGVRCGTRFLAAYETEAHPDYVEALIHANATDTVYTDKFSIGWPDAPHRVLRSSLESVMAFEGDYVGTSCDPITGEIRNIPKYAAVELHKGISGNISAMPHWAGQTVECIKKRQSVSEIIHEIIDDAQRAF